MSGRTSVVVVGSGVAGLAAARTLVDNWPEKRGELSVVVLESGRRLGGRTYTERNVPGWGEISGGEADFGASWIHGSCPKNPITRIKDALGLAGFVTDDGLMDLRRAGGDEVEEDRFDEYEALVKAAEAKAKDSDEDMSIWDAMEDLEEGGGRDDPLMQYHLGNTLEFNVGSSPHTLSAKYYDTDSQYDGEETLLARGYSQIPEALAQGAVTVTAGKDDVAPNVTAASGFSRRALDVRLGQRVVSIVSSGRRIVVGTEGGQSYEADHVVVAVPLGVLKKGTIQFRPALPHPTSTAISRIGFGNVVKIGLLFDEVFWSDVPAPPSRRRVRSKSSAWPFAMCGLMGACRAQPNLDQGPHYFGLVHDEPDMARAEKFTYFLNAAAAIGKPVLFTFAFGRSAWEVETWSDEQVWSAIRANLTAIFGPEDVSRARKLGMWRSRWGHEPDFGGAYSYAAVGSEPSDWEALGQAAMNGRLHLAGEHTSLEFRGTVHGAFLSGQRAAREVLEAEEDADGDD